jgi:hypothetical protein
MIEATEAIGLDRGVMDHDVLALRANNETVTSAVIKPLHGSNLHTSPTTSVPNKQLFSGSQFRFRNFPQSFEVSQRPLISYLKTLRPPKAQFDKIKLADTAQL